MRREPPRTALDWAPLAFPGLMLLVFFVLPLGTMIVVSFYEREAGAFYAPGFTFEHYARFLSSFFGRVLGFSLFLAILVSAVATAIAFPFAWTLTRLSRRAQVAWLIAILSVLSLSEVIIGFAWSTLFSRTAGVGNLFAALGLIEESVAYTPSFLAVATAMTYQVLPYAILVLYPSLVRLDPALPEAARSMGASPARAFFDIVVPVSRPAIVATLIMVFVFALGSYLLPQILGRPSHWTLSVMIADQAIYQSNIPFAAAMAILLALIALALVGLTLLVARRPE